MRVILLIMGTTVKIEVDAVLYRIWERRKVATMDIDLNNVEVVHNPAQKRFEIQLGDQIAMVKYVLGSKEIIFTHTEVPTAFEGKGIAGKIAKVAVEYAKAQELRIRAFCPYMSSYIKRHPEYHSITAGYENESA